MPLARRIIAVLAALALLPQAASAATGVPAELSTDRLDRAALIAIPALYRLELEARVEGLVTAGGRRIAVPEDARDVGRLGTAFAVSPEGYLVSAAHVVAPTAEDLAATVYLQKLAVQGRSHTVRQAREWVQRTGARPVGVQLVSLTVRRASVRADTRGAHRVAPDVVRLDSFRDLALLKIPAADAPALLLDPGREPGTRIVALGFGREDPFASAPRGDLVPGVRRGRLGRTGPVEEGSSRRLTAVTADVQQGDSGGPAVDPRGRVRGVVVARGREGGGLIATSADVAGLLDRAGVRNWEGRTSALFRDALGRLDRYDLAGAREGMRRTLSAFPPHPLARYELQRLEGRSASDLRLAASPRLQGGLLAVAAISAVASVACGFALASRASARGGGTTPAGGPGAHRRTS